MKACFKCGVAKPLDEFYRHPQMGDGHLNKCKACAKADVREHRAANVERFREYDRTRYHLEGARGAASPDVHARAARAWARRNREKRRAQCRLKQAVDAGLLSRPGACQECGAGGRVAAHHHDYAKPLEVEWLCSACHGHAHRRYPVNQEAVERLAERRLAKGR